MGTPLSYNRIAGQSVERLAALSDGIFAVAMTLMVLDLRLPTAGAIHSEHDLWRALWVLLPRLLTYLMSFLTLGIFWVGQQAQLNHLARSDRHLSWIHLGFLFAVTLSPFSTMLLAEFMVYRAALLVYWGNIVLLGWILYGSWGYALRAGIVKADIPADLPAAICRRIATAQSPYAAGALLCVINTYWSIAFILLVQLNYAVAPRFRRAAPAKTAPAGGQVPRRSELPTAFRLLPTALRLLFSVRHLPSPPTPIPCAPHPRPA